MRQEKHLTWHCWILSARYLRPASTCWDSRTGTDVRFVKREKIDKKQAIFWQPSASVVLAETAAVVLYLHHDFSSAWTFVLKNILYYSIEEPFGSIYIHVQKTEYRTDKHFDVKRGGGIIGKVELPGGKYRLLSVLGRGATSVVYLAEKTGSGKRYAVKVSICDREKLRREAFLLQKFSYPGIPCAVELLESGTKKLSGDGSCKRKIYRTAYA